MSKRKPSVKTYEVDFDMGVSIEYTVKAKTKSEAKRKALAMYKRRAKLADFNMFVDRVEE